MPKVQPGRPNASRYSVSTVLFESFRLTVCSFLGQYANQTMPQAFAVQNAIVIYRDIDDFIQTLFCDEYVIGVVLDPRLGSVAILLLPGSNFC
jgi:hypothetical protein